MGEEICTCAGRELRHQTLWTYLSITPPTRQKLYSRARQCSPFMPTVKHCCYNFESLIRRRCFATPLIHPELPDPLNLPSRHRPHITEPEGKEAPYSPPNIERHDVCTFDRGISGQSYRQQATIRLSSMLPVVHRYRADVSLGRFAKADWLRATSGSLWFYFRRERCIVFIVYVTFTLRH